MKLSALIRRLGLSIGLVAVALLIAVCGSRHSAPAEQPFPFNHRVHIEAKVDCLQCHEGLFEPSAPRLPVLKTCQQCHNEPSDKQSLKDLAKLIEQGQELEWHTMFRLADHVFFSHVRHVDIAELACTDCHPDMPQRTSPPDQYRTMSMSHCIDCHERHPDKPAAKRAALDCASCHR